MEMISLICIYSQVSLSLKMLLTIFSKQHFTHMVFFIIAWVFVINLSTE